MSETEGSEMKCSRPLRLSHFSDTHGLPRKSVHADADIIVHTGDLFPNKTRGHREIEPAYQQEWLRKTVHEWARWCGGKPFVYIAGNHDFFDPVPIMRRAGIDAHSADGPVEIGGWRFMGLPDVPWMGGEWNHERVEAEIAERFAHVLEWRPDVIVSHCPPYGVLDVAYGNHIGSTSVATALLYGEHEPRAYLCGHCHEMGGKQAQLRNTIVSNAATTRRAVEVLNG